MADTLITQLPVAIALTGSEAVPVDQAIGNPPGTFTTKRTTTAAIAQLAASSSLVVNQQSGATYAVAFDDRTKLVTFSNPAPVAVDLLPIGPSLGEAVPGWFVQFENRGLGTVTITGATGALIDGAASLALEQNQGVLLAVGDDGNWYSQRGLGLTPATAVTSVGLALPASIMAVSGSPVTTTGVLTGTLVAQVANTLWAGPTAGANAAPTFRSMVTADLPDYGAAGTYGDASNIPVVTTDAKGRTTASTVAITPGSIGQVAASSLVGNATGAPAAATSIALSANFTFTGPTLDLATNGVPYAKIQQVPALSVVGNGTAALANAASITAGTDGWSLRQASGAVGFGPLSLSTPAAVTGTLPAGSGGTGLATYAVGDVLFADTTSSLARLADVATGNALLSGGVGAAPLWGKVGLTTHITGTLGVDHGGTGLAATTAYAVICGGTTTTGPLQSVASVGTAGQVLASNGAGALPTFQTLVANVAATQADQEAATSITTFVSPGRQQFHPSAAKVWFDFNGMGTPAFRETYLGTSITDSGTGDFTISFSPTFSAATYSSVSGAGVNQQSSVPNSVTSVDFNTFSGGTPTDAGYNSGALFGDLT